MASKRLTGITVFAILLIVFSAFGALGFDLSTLRILYQPWPEALVLGRFAVAILLVICGVGAGIGLLKLWEIARKTAIGIGVLSLLAALVEGPLVVWPNMPAAMEAKMAGQMPDTFDPALLDTIMKVSLVVGLVPTLIFYVWMIVYLTRARVRRQFR